ncbi:LysM peptidoglycan-binding domain-containing protein [Oscillibacter sp.]|uniref:LysM peptidoglycan-binding domain-containing protein n=1 Tax=Oscillibacter sp. TaxID=1945593 RepID=UPI0033910ECC
MPSCPSGTEAYIVRPRDSLWLIAQRFQKTTQEILSANPMLNKDNLHIGQTICIPSGRRPHRAGSPPPPQNISKSEQTLSNLMRLLWEQHVYWTRLFLVSTAFGLPDTEPVTNRLLRNPKDFEAALMPIYGENIAAAFAKLFTSHLTIAAELVSAAKAGDSTAAADAEKRWYANANEITAFLNSINPYWSVQEWQKMLYDHLAMTKAEAVAILTQKYQDSIDIFENIEQEALMMADTMTRGLVRQFPQNYR